MAEIRGGLLVKREQAIGVVNSINTDFSTSKTFLVGTLSIYLNGQLLTNGIDFIETSNQTFTMIGAPVSDLNYTDVVLAEYQQ